MLLTNHLFWRVSARSWLQSAVTRHGHTGSQRVEWSPSLVHIRVGLGIGSRAWGLREHMTSCYGYFKFTRTPAGTRAYPQTHKRYAHTRAHTHAFTHTYANARVRTHTLTHTHTHTHTHTNTHTNTHTHTRARAHARTRARAQIVIVIRSLFQMICNAPY